MQKVMTCLFSMQQASLFPGIAELSVPVGIWEWSHDPLPPFENSWLISCHPRLLGSLTQSESALQKTCQQIRIVFPAPSDGLHETLRLQNKTPQPMHVSNSWICF